MTKHTSEPWNHDKPRLVWDKIGRCVADLTSDAGMLRESERTANAARIVACVNACAGIERPEGIGKLVESVESAIGELQLGLTEQMESDLELELTKALKALKGES